jgi:hypothetical protein
MGHHGASIRRLESLCSLASRAPHESSLTTALATWRTSPADASWSAAGRRRRHRTGWWPGPCGRVTAGTRPRGCPRRPAAQASAPSGSGRPRHRARAGVGRRRGWCPRPRPPRRASRGALRASHSSTRWTCGRGSTVTGAVAIEPEHHVGAIRDRPARVGAGSPGAIGQRTTQVGRPPWRRPRASRAARRSADRVIGLPGLGGGQRPSAAPRAPWVLAAYSTMILPCIQEWMAHR